MTKKGTGKVAVSLRDILATSENRICAPLLAFTKARLAEEKLWTKVKEVSPQLADIPLWREVHIGSGKMTDEGIILDIPKMDLPQIEPDAWRQLDYLLARLKQKGLQLRFILTLDEKE